MLRDALEAASKEYPTGTGTADSPEAFGRAVIAAALDAAKQKVATKDSDSVQLDGQFTISVGAQPTNSGVGNDRCIKIQNIWVCGGIKPFFD